MGFVAIERKKDAISMEFGKELFIETKYFITQSFFLGDENTLVEHVYLTEEKNEQLEAGNIITPTMLVGALREIPIGQVSPDIITELKENDIIENIRYISETEAKKIVDDYQKSDNEEELFNLINVYIKIS